MNRFWILCCTVLIYTIWSCQNKPSPPPPEPPRNSQVDSIQLPEQKPAPNPIRIDYDTLQWQELRETASRILDFRYATENNFLKQAVYPCGRCFLRPAAAKALGEAEKYLEKQGLGLILYDCYRPRPVQFRMWEILPDKRYVSDPNKGSMHNRGLAVDLGLIDTQGKVLDMGTDFDYFGPEAWHEYRNLDTVILANRALLKTTMERYGFRPIRTEWWHYSYQGSGGGLDEFVWSCPEMVKKAQK
ncbi:MAG: M15 family metallopeptidase [Bacteroidota bacterium]